VNALGFVFSILLILSFGFSICLEKQMGAQRLRSTYLGHCHANRNILRQCESELYHSLAHKSLPVKPALHQKSQKEGPQSIASPQINPKCACLNLFPLTQKDKREEPLLYETAAKLLNFFYGSALFGKKPQAEFQFLNAYLQAIQASLAQQTPLMLEKIRFKNPAYQALYYKMLKGTKNPTAGYPSLLEYIKVEPHPSKICLFHAHPCMISVLFGPKASEKIYQTIHQKKAPLITKELIERLCSEAHTLIYDTTLFDLVELNRTQHPRAPKKMLVGEDQESHIVLKKNVVLNG
jgi:hypothetical protein